MAKLRIPKMPLVKLLQLLKEFPMYALRSCRDAFQTSAKTHNETVYETIAFIVAFYLELYDSPEKRNEFLADKYWEDKPQPPKEKNLVRLTAMYMVGATQSKGALYVQALEYTKVAKYFIALGVEPEAIPEELKRKPIYRIIDELEASQSQEGEAGKAEGGGSQPKRTPTDQTATSDQNGDDDADNNDDDDGTNKIDSQLNRQESVDLDDDEEEEHKERESGTVPTKRGRYPFDLNAEAAIRYNEFFPALYELEEQEEDEEDSKNFVDLRVRRLKDKNGWMQLEIIDIVKAK